MTLIPQHALAQTEEDAPPRSVGEDVPLRLAEQVRPAPTDLDAPPRSTREEAPQRLVEQARPAPTDPIGGLKRPITDVAELESSG